MLDRKLGKPRYVLVARQGDDLVIVRVSADEIERVFADRARGAQNADALRFFGA